MKKEISLFLLLALFLVFCAVQVSAQNQSDITVRRSELNSGVMVVEIVREAKSYRLQCNFGASLCAALKEGQYVMVELPENFGMYECKCVDVYPGNTAAPQKEPNKKLGEYCLIEK